MQNPRDKWIERGIMSNNTDYDDYYIDVKPAMRYFDQIVSLFNDPENYRELDNGDIEIILYGNNGGEICLANRNYDLKPLGITYDASIMESITDLFAMNPGYSAEINAEKTMIRIEMKCGYELAEEEIDFYDDDYEEAEEDLGLEM